MASLVRRACWGLIAVLMVALVWTAAVLLLVRSDLGDARRSLEAAADSEERDQVAAPLDEARRKLTQADGRLRQPGPRVVAVLPIVGRTVTAVQRATEATLAVATSGEELLDALPAELVPDGRFDVEALRQVAAAAQRAQARSRGPVARLDEAELGLVPGVVADRVREARERLRAAPDAFARTTSAVDGLTGLLGSARPRQVLVMLQNNAELRGGGGVVTVFAQATAQDGRLDVSAFRDVQDVADTSDEVQRVPAPADYRALWGPFLADSTLWLNVNMTPDVPTASAVLAEVAVASGLPRPESVLWFDVPAIVALLGATGPVDLPDGSRLSAENAVRVLLSDAYAQADDTREGQAARRAALRGAADAVLGRLFSADGLDAPVSRLAEALAEAASGRHLALWSADEQEQRSLLAGGLAGEVRAEGGDLSAVALQNFGGGSRQGNKLDYYARRQVTVRALVGEDEAVVEQEIALRNTAPAQGLPAYVAGEVEPGTSRNYAALALPEGARDVQLTRGGRQVAVAPLPSGDHLVVTDGLVLAPGAEATWLLHYRVPLRDGRYDLHLVPQPLAVDAGLRVEVSAADGRRLEGDDVADGRLVLSEAFAQRRTVSVQAVRPGLLRRAADAVRRFWNEPVELP